MAARINKAQMRLDVDTKPFDKGMKKAEATAAKTVKSIDQMEASPEISLDTKELIARKREITRELNQIDRMKADVTLGMDKKLFDMRRKELMVEKAALSKDVEIKVKMDQNSVRTTFGVLRAMKEHLFGADSGVKSLVKSMSKFRVQLGPISGTLQQFVIALGILGPIVVQLAGSLAALAGVIGTGLAGALTVASAAGAGFIATFAGIALVVKPLIQHFTLATKAVSDYKKAVLQYGKGSTQAQTALEKMNHTLEGLSPSARSAVTGFSKLQESFKKITQPAQGFFWEALDDGIKAARANVKVFGTEIVKTMGVASSSIKGASMILRGDTFGKGLETVMGNFRKALPNILEGFGHIAVIFGHIAESASRWLPSLTHGFERWANALKGSVGHGDTLDKRIDRIIGHMKDLGHLLQAAGSLVVHFFNAGADSGDRMVETLTRTIKGWDRWVQSMRGQNQLKEFFKGSEVTTGQVLDSLGRLLHIFVTLGIILAPVSDGFVQLLDSVAKVVTELSKLEGFNDVMKVLGATLGTIWAINKVQKFAGMVRAAGIALGIFSAEGAIAGASLSAIIWPVAGVIALGAAFFIAYKKVKPFHKAVDEVTKSFKQTVGPIVHLAKVINVRFGGVLTFITDLTKDRLNTIKNYFVDMNNLIRHIVNLISALLTGKWGRAWKEVKAIFRTGKDIVIHTMETLVSPLKRVLQLIDRLMTKAFGNIWKSIKTIFKDGAQVAIDVLNEMIDLINNVPFVDIGKIGSISAKEPHEPAYAHSHARGGKVKRAQRATGGVISGEGKGDTVPLWAAPGEAIVNRHQQPAVESALAASKAMGVQPYGSMNELFRKEQTPHYMARGGFAHFDAPKYDIGGFIGDAINAVGDEGANILRNTVGKAAGFGVNWLVDRVPTPPEPFEPAPRAFAERAIPWLSKETKEYGKAHEPQGIMHGSGPVEKTFAAVAKKLSVSKTATLALGEAGYAESGMRDLAGGDQSSQGALQLLSSTAAGLGVSPHDESAIASIFFTRGFTGAGGANALANQGLPAHLVAQGVQGSAFSSGSNYAAQYAPAKGWMRRYKLRAGGFVRKMRSGGMINPGWDPGSETINSSIDGTVGPFNRKFNLDITAGYDPGGGHKSHGHNVSGTATDIVPGGGGSWNQLERGLGYLVKAGFEVGYDGARGTMNWPDHGRYNHAHVEWVHFPENTTTANARKKLRSWGSRVGFSDGGGGGGGDGQSDEPSAGEQKLAAGKATKKARIQTLKQLWNKVRSKKFTNIEKKYNAYAEMMKHFAEWGIWDDPHKHKRGKHGNKSFNFLHMISNAFGAANPSKGIHLMHGWAKRLMEGGIDISGKKPNPDAIDKQFRFKARKAAPRKRKRERKLYDRLATAGLSPKQRARLERLGAKKAGLVEMADYYASAATDPLGEEGDFQTTAETQTEIKYVQQWLRSLWLTLGISTNLRESYTKHLPDIQRQVKRASAPKSKTHYKLPGLKRNLTNTKKGIGSMTNNIRNMRGINPLGPNHTAYGGEIRDATLRLHDLKGRIQANDQLALGELTSLDLARYDLFSQFGSNFRGGPIGASAFSGPQYASGGLIGGPTDNSSSKTVTFGDMNFGGSPSDPHTFANQMAWEAQAAF